MLEKVIFPLGCLSIQYYHIKKFECYLQIFNSHFLMSGCMFYCCQNDISGILSNYIMIMLSNNILHQGLQLWIEFYQWNGTERSFNNLHDGRSVSMKVDFHSYVCPTLTLNHLLFIMGILHLKSWALYWNSTQKPPIATATEETSPSGRLVWPL